MTSLHSLKPSGQVNAETIWKTLLLGLARQTFLKLLQPDRDTAAAATGSALAVLPTRPAGNAFVKDGARGGEFVTGVRLRGAPIGSFRRIESGKTGTLSTEVGSLTTRPI